MASARALEFGFRGVARVLKEKARRGERPPLGGLEPRYDVVRKVVDAELTRRP